MQDLNTSGHTVKVSNADDNKAIGLFKTIPATDATRDLRDTDTVLLWSERAAGQPQAVREWYYPGRSIGEEFVYPKEQALAIAAANKASVPTEEDGKIVRVGAAESASASPAAAARSESTQAAAAPAGQTPAPAAAEQTSQPPAQSTAAQRPRSESTSVGTSGQAPAAPRRLPSTASSLALVGMLSGLSFLAALSVRRLRRARS
jgi:hypothetical protein